MAQEDEPASAPRKRARAADVDEDEDEGEAEGDRPRRKQKHKKSGGVPLLLILGGLAAVVFLVLLAGGGLALYFFVLRKGPDTAGAPAKGPGSKSEPVAIKFRVPAKAGEVYDFEVTSTSSAKNLNMPGQDKSVKVVVQGSSKALRVDARGRESQSELRLKKLTMDKGFGDTTLLAPNTVVLREVNGVTRFVTYSVKGGGVLSADAQLALQEVFGKGLKDDDLDEDEVFGTTDKKVVGDSWPVKKGPVARSFNEGAGGAVVIRDDSVSGNVKFSSVTEEAEVSYLNVDVTISINQNGAAVNAVPGVQQTMDIALTMNLSYRIPADYSSNAVRQTLKADGRVDTTAQGPGGLVKATVAILTNKVGTRKYQSGPAQSRDSLANNAGSSLLSCRS